MYDFVRNLFTIVTFFLHTSSRPSSHIMSVPASNSTTAALPRSKFPLPQLDKLGFAVECTSKKYASVLFPCSADVVGNDAVFLPHLKVQEDALTELFEAAKLSIQVAGKYGCHIMNLKSGKLQAIIVFSVHYCDKESRNTIVIDRLIATGAAKQGKSPVFGHGSLGRRLLNVTAFFWR